LGKAKAFVFAGKEDFGIAPLEAYVCVCACTISKAIFLLSVYENSVGYFDLYSIDSVKTKIEEMIDNKDKRKTLVNFGALNLKRFDWDTSTSKLKSLIEKSL
jgi:glycosyltransferase involved in cell wall biosynthesis